MEDLPTYYEYSTQVDHLVSSGKLTLEQGIILCTCFKATLNEHPVHINFLMQVSGLNWKQVNASINGLVQRGALRGVGGKQYMI
tara:strand:+ start:229 stop:480 length:252 start_codon:yes stop_codon:yes gene_type:complete